MRYISAVHRPIPRTDVRRAIRSSSLRLDVRVRTTVPSSTFALRSRSDASLFPESPAARIPLEVVLVLGLRLPEGSGRRNLGHDLSRPAARGIDVRDRLLGDPALLVVEVEDRRAVARSDVVPLTVHGRRIVNPEEELE